MCLCLCLRLCLCLCLRLRLRLGSVCVQGSRTAAALALLPHGNNTSTDHHAACTPEREQRRDPQEQDDNLDFYIRQSAEILGVTEKLPEGKRSAKHCLEIILKELVNWKRLSPDTTSAGAPLNGGTSALGPHL